MAVGNRPYRHADLSSVIALLEERLSAGLAWNLSAAEVRLVLPRRATDTERNGRVWEDEAGRTVGFALVWPPWNTVQLLVHPEHDPERVAEAELFTAMLAWAVDHGAQLAREGGKAVKLGARAREDEPRLVALLERHGFGQANWCTVKYRRTLDGPLPAPVLPAGFTIRPVLGEDEAEAYAALHREAFGTPRMQAEERLALMRDPDYVPDLDLVAVTTDGTLAAFVVGGIDREASTTEDQLVGFTDPLGTRPAYRRLGLARALLYEAFHRLRRHGAVVSTVSTSSANAPTMRLLESVGYESSYKLLAYARTVG